MPTITLEQSQAHRDAVRADILSREEPATCQEIAAAVKIPLRSVSNYLTRLRQEGAIDRRRVYFSQTNRWGEYRYGRPEVLARHLPDSPDKPRPQLRYDEEQEVSQDAMRALLASLVQTAVESAQGEEDRSRARARRWLAGKDCEGICCYLGVNWERIQSQLRLREEEALV